MNKKIIIILLFMFFCMVSSCGGSEDINKTYHVKFMVDEEIYQEVEVEESNFIDETLIETPTKINHIFLGWYNNEDLFNFNEEINSELSLQAKFKEATFNLSLNQEQYKVGELSKIKLTFDENCPQSDVVWSIDNSEVGRITSKKSDLCSISLEKEGSITVTASLKNTTYSKSITINVLPDEYLIVYDLKGVSDAKIINQIDNYTKYDYPLVLPTVTSSEFYFLGWTVNDSNELYKVINQGDFELNELRLQARFVKPTINIDNELYQVLKPALKYQLKLSNNFNEEKEPSSYSIKVNDPSIVLYENGYIIGQNIGTTTIEIQYKDEELTKTVFGITVVEDTLYDLEEFKMIISKQNLNPFYQRIMVYGWQKKYEFDMYESISKHLFEEYEIIENIAPITNVNRPGTKAEKYYICVHDTGDAEYTAKEWSETVYNYYNKQNNEKYDASYQYVVGNDGIYHNIPDDEVSWHAGDGTRNPYKLTATGVYGTNKYPNVGISTDGFYTIDNQKTTIKAPTKGNGEILTSKDINDVGIRVIKSENNEYLIGNTYYNDTYRKISNYGGNVNSIGIESCINYGSDIYYTWQKLAALVAHLMDENNLTIDDVVPHHYFSGKNCPQTIRENDRWEYFKSLICDEYDILMLLKKGVKLNLITDSIYLNNLGRVIKQPENDTLVSYILNIEIDNSSYNVKLYSNIQGSNNNKINK